MPSGASAAFLSNFDATAARSVTYHGRAYRLANHSVVLLDVPSGAVLWNSSDVSTHAPRPVARVGEVGEVSEVSDREVSAAGAWEVYTETPGFGARRREGARPLEQLALTNDDTDYLWYARRAFSDDSGWLGEVGFLGKTYVWLDTCQVQRQRHGSAGMYARAERDHRWRWPWHHHLRVCRRPSSRWQRARKLRAL